MTPKQRQTLAGLTVADLVARISGDDISPGAGAAGAVALAIAAACAGKAVAISRKHRPAEVRLQLASERFREVARLALTDADRDAVAFESFIRENSPDTVARLVRQGEHVAGLIEALLGAIDAIDPHVEPSMAGDLAAARVLADAARCIQQRNDAEARDADPQRPAPIIPP